MSESSQSLSTADNPQVTTRIRNRVRRWGRQRSKSLAAVARVLECGHGVATFTIDANGVVCAVPQDGQRLFSPQVEVGQSWLEVIAEPDREEASRLTRLAMRGLVARGVCAIISQEVARVSIAVQSLPGGDQVVTMRALDRDLADFRSLEVLADQDPMSGLLNRGAFFRRGVGILNEHPPSGQWAIAHFMLKLHGEGSALLSIAEEELMWTLAAARIATASGGVLIARTATHQMSVLFAARNPVDAKERTHAWVAAGYEGHDPNSLWQPHVGIRAGVAVQTTEQSFRQLSQDAARCVTQATEKAWGSVVLANGQPAPVFTPAPQLPQDQRPSLKFGTQILAASGDPTHVIAQLDWTQLSEVEESTGPDGTVVQVSCRSLRAAMSHVRSWRSTRFAHVGLILPIAEHLLAWPGFVDYVERSLAMSSLPPGAVTLVFDTQVLARQQPTSFAHLALVRQLGLRIAVAFSGGSVAFFDALREFAVDEVVFSVADMLPDTSTRSVSMLSSLVDLVTNLGARCVVTEVESVDQVKALQRIGVYRIGGPWCSPVTGIDDIPQVLVGLSDRARRYRDGEEVFEIPQLMQGADSATIDLTD